MEVLTLAFPNGAPSLESLAGALMGFGRVELSSRGNDEAASGIIVREDDDYALIEGRLPEESAQDVRLEIEERWPPELLPLPERAGFYTVEYHRWQPLPKQIVIALAAQYEFLVETNNYEIYTSRAFAARSAMESEWLLDPSPNEVLRWLHISAAEKEEWRRQHPRPPHPMFYETWPPQ
jgi:hypothetical protein